MMRRSGGRGKGGKDDNEDGEALRQAGGGAGGREREMGSTIASTPKVRQYTCRCDRTRDCGTFATVVNLSWTAV